MAERRYRKDYRPPNYRIERCELAFDIGDNAVLVHSRLEVQSLAGGPWRLDGRGLGLESISVDGRELAGDEYRRDDESLVLLAPPAAFVLETRVRIDPFANTSLEGLYAAGDMLCSQCEAHGFSRISYFPDRPDVLPVFSLGLTADARRYPVLLSNGECVSAEALSDGRQRVRWHDPHPKPCYLFAVVAGDLARRDTRFTTCEGREVGVSFYCDHGLEDQLDHAMDSLLRAMRWDEERYGRAYDLATYSVVVAAAFNMGAMENKGLNIFNPKYVLASPQTATDTDFSDVEAVIAHEYFHNWTGNRVTCRDWFQLSLKEGLTVFREQQFAADAGAGPVQRIHQVRMLRGRQFAEDAGPLAHPVRPDSYLEMNNFYTLTVYEKGAELVRLLHARLGEAGFRRGMDTYFERHDGQAVTIEDFLAAHGDANGVETDGILRWYGQAGTPLVTIRDEYQDGVYRLHLSQSVPGQPQADPVLIPLRLDLLAADGSVLPAPDEALVFEQAEQSFEWPTACRPTPILFAGLSAPVRWDYPYTAPQLATLLRHAGDPVARWDAAQRLWLDAIDARYAGRAADLDAPLFGALLAEEGDRAIRAELLTAPRADELGDRYPALDPPALEAAIRGVEGALATALGAALAEAYAAVTARHPYVFSPEEVAARRWRAQLLRLWVVSGDPVAVEAARRLYVEADNLSDRLAAMQALNRGECPVFGEVLEDFYSRYHGDRLVLDRWFALQACRSGPDAVEQIETLLQHPQFDVANPNRVRALLGSFAQHNPTAFYRDDGRGLALYLEQLLRLDQRNPQLAARLLAPLAILPQLVEPHQSRLREGLVRLRGEARSPDVEEQISRLLAANS